MSDEGNNTYNAYHAKGGSAFDELYTEIQGVLGDGLSVDFGEDDEFYGDDPELDLLSQEGLLEIIEPMDFLGPWQAHIRGMVSNQPESALMGARGLRDGFVEPLLENDLEKQGAGIRETLESFVEEIERITEITSAPEAPEMD